MINELHKIYPHLYGKLYNEDRMDKRFSFLLDNHKKLFDRNSEYILSSSGRTELCGNHTDHNYGLTVSASINLDSIASVSRRDDNLVYFYSKGYPEIMVNLSSLEVKKELFSTTSSLITGIAKGMLDFGYKIGGWNAYVESSVLSGSGLSSSASIEILISEIFNTLYNDDKIDKLTLSRIGQYAENVYYNKPCGLLDQLSCSEGGIISTDFKDKTKPIINKYSFSPENFGYSIIITNTHSSHNNLDSEYGAIPREMKSVASFFGKETLREVNEEDFFSSVSALRKSIKNDRAILRSYHYFNENKRVLKMIDAMNNNDINSYLECVKESGNSSYKYLQNIYVENKNEALSLALALSEEILKDDGAVRVHGGGFAGTIQAYVKKNKVKDYIKVMDNIFGDGSAEEIAIREIPSGRII